MESTRNGKRGERFVRFNTNSSEDHMTALHREMSYAVNSPKRGVTLAPQGEWSGDPAYEFQLTGMA
jgi:hypothetical protein